jgi:hypothetical protein
LTWVLYHSVLVYLISLKSTQTWYKWRLWYIYQLSQFREKGFRFKRLKKNTRNVYQRHTFTVNNQYKYRAWAPCRLTITQFKMSDINCI